MKQEKELNNKIYEFEEATRRQNEKLKLQLGGTAEDQSMSKRKADSDGEENTTKRANRYRNRAGAHITPHQAK